MSKPINKVITVDIPIYKTSVTGYFMPIEAFANHMFKKYEYTVSSEYLAGRCLYLENETNQANVVWVDSMPEVDICIISHEALHAAVNILDRIGIALTPENDEALAYLHEYILKSFMKKLGIKH